MRASLILSALALAAPAIADTVPEGIAPDGASPDGCEQTVDYNFTIGIAVGTGSAKRDVASADSAVGCTLKDGVLKDPYNRVGSIVANYQFQFDGPPQAGAIYTGGFAVCKNSSLALGSSTRWWRCMSGDFGNLYDRSIGDQCSEVRIVAQSVESSSSSSMASSTSASSKASGSASGTITSASGSGSASATPTFSVISVLTPNSNSSVTAVTPSVGSASATRTGSQASSSTGPAPDAKGAAAPTRVPKRETFGAVIGLLGAALLL